MTMICKRKPLTRQMLGKTTMVILLGIGLSSALGTVLQIAPMPQTLCLSNPSFVETDPATLESAVSLPLSKRTARLSPTSTSEQAGQLGKDSKPWLGFAQGTGWQTAATEVLAQGSDPYLPTPAHGTPSETLTRPRVEEQLGTKVRQIIAEVYDIREDATTEASLHSALRREIRKLAQEIAEVSLTDQQAERELIWLRKHPLIQEKAERLEHTDPLSGSSRITRRIVLSLTPELLEEWSSRLNQTKYERYWGYVYGGLCTIAIWIVGLLALAGLDRWTGGYRRFAIVVFGVATLVMITGAIWLAVYTAYLR